MDSENSKYTIDFSCLAKWMSNARLRGIRALSASIYNNTSNPTANTVTKMVEWHVNQTILLIAVHLSTAIACKGNSEIVLAAVQSGTSLNYPLSGQSSDQILMSHVCLPNSDGSTPYLTQSNKTNKMILPNPILIGNNRDIGLYCRSSDIDGNFLAFATFFYTYANDSDINYIQHS